MDSGKTDKRSDRPKTIAIEEIKTHPTFMDLLPVEGDLLEKIPHALVRGRGIYVAPPGPFRLFEFFLILDKRYGLGVMDKYYIAFYLRLGYIFFCCIKICIEILVDYYLGPSVYRVMEFFGYIEKCGVALYYIPFYVNAKLLHQRDNAI